MTRKTLGVLALTLSLLSTGAGCKKKIGNLSKPDAPAAPAPPPPRMEEPKVRPTVATFTAEPSAIEKGASSTLRWLVKDATKVTITAGVGEVTTLDGSRSVFPGATTTYRLMAEGPGGTAESSATVTVTQPPPPAVEAPKATKEDFSVVVSRELGDVFFDYDKSDISESGRGTLTRNADKLKQLLIDYPSAIVTIEGHCDERGSAEYNLGLGDRRALSAMDFLKQLGVAADRVRTVSYGKERPQCTDANEDCYQKNRRAHFSGN